MNLFELGRPLLFSLDPESAHRLTIKALRSGLPLAPRVQASDRLTVKAAGLSFPNPLGMAAGFDKNAEAPDGLLALGFGLVEVGTVTPLPQPGNDRPRIFRLTRDCSVINRMGFNNEGHEACLTRVMRRKNRPGIVGVNIGANKDSADRIADYEIGARRFAPVADYLTINISSPNTPGLRNLQSRESLAELLSRTVAARDEASRDGGRPTPIFLKIAPDLRERELAEIAEEVLDKKIDGVIATNTTLSREGLSSELARETGGMSGRPLFDRATTVLARMRRLLGPDMLLIGVGGVDSAETALEKIRAGADLVQLYTSMIYAGPSLPGGIVRGMDEYTAQNGLSSIRDIRDSHLDRWAARQLG